ncbi:hypothetical protein BAA08_01075 [Bizionia sp. APA-3]|nr:hypothetical protein BAA08_01075 [Bizionia sp. APA-3]
MFNRNETAYFLHYVSYTRPLYAIQKLRVTNTDRTGVYVSALIFTKELNWIFREQPIVDVGIDALTEEVIESNPTGQFLATQIKTGLGNFHDAKTHLTLYVSKIHYHYWTNLNLPIILIAHLPESEETLWELISENTLIKTGTQWKLNIPKDKELNKDSKLELTKILKNEVQDDFIKSFIKQDISTTQIDEIIEESKSIDEAGFILNDMTEIIENLGTETNQLTEKINEFARMKVTKKDKRLVRTIKTYAEYLNNVAIKLNVRIDDFADYFSEGFRAYEKLTLIDFELNQNYKSLQETLDTINSLIPELQDSIDAMIHFRNEVSSLPTEYFHLKKARLKMINSINQIMEEFKLANSLSENFSKNLEEMLT